MAVMLTAGKFIRPWAIRRFSGGACPPAKLLALVPETLSAFAPLRRPSADDACAVEQFLIHTSEAVRGRDIYALYCPRALVIGSRRNRARTAKAGRGQAPRRNSAPNLAGGLAIAQPGLQKR